MTSKAKHLLHVSKIPLVFQEMSLATLTFLIEDHQPDSKGIVSSSFTYLTFKYKRTVLLLLLSMIFICFKFKDFKINSCKSNGELLW